MKKIILTLFAVALMGIMPLAAAETDSSSTKTEQQAKGGKKSQSGKKASDNKKKQTPARGDWKKSPYMAFKTNIAYDAIGVLNLAYECQIARKWSAELPVMYGFPQWKDDRGLRLTALQPGVKYWFGNVGEGHAVGADVALGWYNYTWGTRRYQDTERPLMGVSLNYAYTLNMGKGWKAEFQLGVGYVNTRYNTYYNIENGALINTRDRNYFGPTRIGISLVYSL